MAVDDKYVMNGVWLTCDKGVTPSRFNVTPKPVQLYDEHFANELDKIPLVNIQPFGACSVKYGSPCVPVPVAWERVMDDGLTVLGARPLLDTSKCQCGIGGQISIHFTRADASAAVALDQNLDQVDEAANQVEKAAGWAFWGGLACAVGGAILVATGVGAPLGAAMIVGGGELMEASTVLASAAAVVKGATKFARDPSKEVGLSIVGEVATTVAINFVMNKLGGAVVKKLGTWAQKGLKKLNLSERASSIANRLLCTVTGHPVDVISGYLYTETVDFEFPGPLPLRWGRLWNSTSIHAGALGHGWHHSYDLALVVEEAEGYAALRGADGRGLAFDLPALGERAFNRLEKMSLLRDARGYGVLDHGAGLTYRFGLTRPDGVRTLTAVENANGFAIRFTYNERGHLTQVVDSARRELAVSCDEAGRILTISTAHPTEPRQRVTLVAYFYNGRGELVRATDALEQAATYQYQHKLLVQETLKNELSFYFEYEGVGPAARCVHTWGDEGIYDHRLVYDLEARRTVVTNSLGYATTYIGNENGLVVEVQDARGGVTRTEYNEFNEVLNETDSLGYVTTYTYDERGNRLCITQPAGAEERQEYDAHGRLVVLMDSVGGCWQWTYDGAGNLLTQTNPLGSTRRYTYTQGLLTRLTDDARQVTELVYDETFNVREQRTPQGSSRWLQDGWGRTRKRTDARGNVQWRTYDLLGRITTLHEPDGNVRQLTYDGLDNVVRIKDRLHDVHYAYRGLGRLIRRAEAGTAIEFLHDTEQQLRAVVNEHGLAYRFELDTIGEVVTEVGFDGLTRRYQRDIAGRIVELELPTSQRTRYTHDPAGRTTSVQYADGQLEAYTYRADGALLSATNATVAVSYKRDILGNVLQETQGAHTLTHTYDLLGQRVGLISSLGADVHYTRNESGQLTQLNAGTWQALFERDKQGLELHRTLSGGVRTRWKRDNLGRPTEQCISTGLSGVKRTRTYEWQTDDQLTHIYDSQHGVTRFTHDALGNLAATTFGDGAHELRLPDAVGNLFQTTDRSDRQYGPAGQLLEAKGTRYQYDVLGNLVHKQTVTGQHWHYGWTSAGYLAEVVRPDGEVVRFAYDALGRRVRKIYQGRTTCWMWNGNVPLHEWQQLDPRDEAEQVVTWLFEDDSFVPIAKLEPNGNYSVVADQVGTPLALYNKQGALTWQMQLDSYGQVREGKGQAQDCPFRYQGQYEDVETGLYYNRFRYYDPKIGQYISQDPIDLMGGLALYSYVTDPTTYVDAWGLLGEGEVARYGSRLHRGDGLEAHELLRNKFLQDNSLTGARRHPGNPSIALSPTNHDLVHAEEFRLRRSIGLGNNEMLKTGKHEIRLAAQAVNNTLVQTGEVSIQQLRTARRSAENFAKRSGCH